RRGALRLRRVGAHAFCSAGSPAAARFHRLGARGGRGPRDAAQPAPAHAPGFAPRRGDGHLRHRRLGALHHAGRARRSARRWRPRAPPPLRRAHSCPQRHAPAARPGRVRLPRRRAHCALAHAPADPRSRSGKLMLLLVALLLSNAPGNAAEALDRLMGRIAAHGAAGKAVATLADKVLTFEVTSQQDQSDEEDSGGDEESDDDLEVIPPVAPVAPVPPLPPGPPVPPSRHRRIWRAGDKSVNFEFHTGDPGAELPRFTEKGKNVATVDVLHRIAQTAGWSMTLVGSPKERIDIDVQDADPREAL